MVIDDKKKIIAKKDEEGKKGKKLRRLNRINYKAMTFFFTQINLKYSILPK